MMFSVVSDSSGEQAALWILLWIAVCVVILLLLVFLLLGVCTIYNKASVRRCSSSTSLEGKTVIVTGASAGIGKEAAQDFAKRNAKVILACRNLTKAQKVADDIKASTGNRNIHVKVLDTSVLSSVRAFAKYILEQETRLDILVLNAGTGGPTKRMETEDGLEMTMATNHFGHFLLVNILLDLLKKSSPSRIVVTSSMAHYLAFALDPKDLNNEGKRYRTLTAYSQSKLCNVLMTKHLANCLQGKGVTVNVFCPGMVKTEIFEKLDGSIGTLSNAVASLVGRETEEGAQTLVHLAVCKAVDGVTGTFFKDCKACKHSCLADDTDLIEEVWAQSEKIVKLTPEERGIKKNF